MSPLNTNASVNISASTFFSELMNISTDIVWKDQALANKCENADNYIEVEMFLAANRGLLSFDSIYQFDYDTLISAGLSEDQADAGVDLKSSIPVAYRDACTAKYISRMLSKDPMTGRYLNYEERNNYYRMLYGLPDYEDDEFVYNTKYLDVSKDIPVHMLSLQDRYLLESRGYIDTLISENPTKKYLKFITNRLIDPFIAREASKFAILWMQSSEFSSLVSDFRTVYDDCRNNILRVYYTDAFRRDSAHYEGFMAMSVLFMTIQLMHYKYLDVDITRDFYDLDSIRYIYDSYSVPFYSSIPIAYHTKIVKNINRLLSYKGSTRVFFDLFELFDYASMDVYEYYLLRSHKFVDNAPLFVKKPDGSYDYQAMYDIKFAKVRLYDNPPMEISDPSNHIDYHTMTALDPYWVSDEELLNKLYSTNFNYLETKYVGIQTLFDMTKIMYESSFFFKMLIDNRSIMSKTSIYISSVAREVNLFTLAIYTSALICSKYGYVGNISSSLPSVAKIIGFDFKKDLSIVQADILKDPNLKNDTELLNLISNMNINNLSSINATFKRISNLRELLTNRKFSAKTRDSFYAYYNLERTLMTSSLIDDVYKKTNGNTADSFSDLLLNIDSELYVRLNSADFDVGYEIDVILAAMKQSITSLQLIEFADGTDISSVIEHLFKILDFFKSAKSELTGYNIVYTLSSRGANMLKFLDEISLVSNKNSYEDNIKYLTDLLNVGIEIYHNKSQLSLSLDKITDPKYKVSLIDKINTFDDMLTLLSSKILLDSEDLMLDINDIITVGMFTSTLKSTMSFKDKKTLMYEHIDYEGHSAILADKFISIFDAIHYISRSWNINETDLTKMKDSVFVCIEKVVSVLGDVTSGRLLAFDKNAILFEKNDLVDDKFRQLIDSMFGAKISNEFNNSFTVSDIINSMYLLLYIKDSTNQLPFIDKTVKHLLSLNVKDILESLVDNITSSILCIYSPSDKYNFKDNTIDISSIVHSNLGTILVNDIIKHITIPFRMVEPLNFTDVIKQSIYLIKTDNLTINARDLLAVSFVKANLFLYTNSVNMTDTINARYQWTRTNDLFNSIKDMFVYPTHEKILPVSNFKTISDTICKIIMATVILRDKDTKSYTDILAKYSPINMISEMFLLNDSLTLISEKKIVP